VSDGILERRNERKRTGAEEGEGASNAEEEGVRAKAEVFFSGVDSKSIKEEVELTEREEAEEEEEAEAEAEAEVEAEEVAEAVENEDDGFTGVKEMLAEGLQTNPRLVLLLLLLLLLELLFPFGGRLVCVGLKAEEVRETNKGVGVSEKSTKRRRRKEKKRRRVRKGRQRQKGKRKPRTFELPPFQLLPLTIITVAGLSLLSIAVLVIPCVVLLCFLVGIHDPLISGRCRCRRRFRRFHLFQRAAVCTAAAAAVVVVDAVVSNCLLCVELLGRRIRIGIRIGSG
jgi:hypothetical protein